MPQKTDLNVNPYFDDFDANNQHYRVLFKPSVPVQARELTGLQSILQGQIESLAGLHLRNGDIVSGCAIHDIPSMPFVRLSDFQANGASYTVANLINKQVVSASSNLAGRILTSNSGQQSQYPNTNVVYYMPLGNGSNATSNQITTFSNTDQLIFYNIPRTGNDSVDIVAIVNTYPSNATTNCSGNAHAITVDSGIVFLSGCLVQVLQPTIGIVNATGTYAANLVVGFQASESIINSDIDSDLLDNALGYTNENAPGADRLKIAPTLVALDPNTAITTQGFNPIAVYNFGNMVTDAVAGSNVYSIVGEAIAQRIYDEAGNYVVNPFRVDSVTSTPDSTIAPSNTSYYLSKVSPGLGYALGNRVELLKSRYINMRRGTDVQVNQAQQITFDYGSYFLLTEVGGAFAFTNAASVSLYDTYQQSVTNRTFASGAPSGNLIGTAAMRCFSYASGTPGTPTAQYLLHVYNVSMANTYNTNQIKSVYYNGGTFKGIGDLALLGLQGDAADDQLFTFGTRGIQKLRDGSNNNSSQYTYRTVNTATMTTTGNIVVTIPSSATGGVDILPYGVGTLPDSQGATFTVTIGANAATANLSGTITTTSQNVVGTSTTFLTDFNVGDQITASATTRTVQSVVNNTFMSLDAAFGSNLAANTYVKTFTSGKLINISQATLGKTSWVSVTNTTSFTIVTQQVPTSGTTVYVTYDVLRTLVSPANKVINKYRMVKINTANNAGGPTGPWCLGFSDVHRIRKIYGTAGGGFTTSGTDLTTSFVFDPGQRDTNYAMSYIYPKTAVSANQLLVVLDYFSTNTSPGLGFYTVESYPIDDANTSNTTAITTSEIPLYVDEQGNRIHLRDVVDFRTPVTPTANDTGYIDLSNTSQVTAGITNASLNPSANITFNVPGTGLNNPSFGKNFQATYTMYLPRKDLLTITTSGSLVVKEGVPSLNPQTPLYPDNVMPLAVINIPVYPSLTSDQCDAFLSLNQSALTLIRDTSTAITNNLVTNRRYTMRDIGVLDQRITNIEYYEQLNSLQVAAKNMTVTDEYGLDRYKNGIFVDPFSDFTASEVSSPDYSIAIDSSKGIARPKIQREVFRVNFNSGTSVNVQRTGRCITLPYTEVAYMNQPYATKYRTAAPVAFAWNGVCFLLPNYDNHSDIINTGSVNVTVDNTIGWREFANTPFASIWGDWRTTTNTITTTTVTNATGTTTTSTSSGGSATTVYTSANTANTISSFTNKLYNIYGVDGTSASGLTLRRNQLLITAGNTLFQRL